MDKNILIENFESYEDKLHPDGSEYVWDYCKNEVVSRYDFLSNHSHDISHYKVIAVPKDVDVYEKDSFGKYAYDFSGFSEFDESDSDETFYYLVVFNNSCCTNKYRAIVPLLDKANVDKETLENMATKEYYDIIEKDLENSGESYIPISWVIDEIYCLDEDDEDDKTRLSAFENVEKLI